MRISLLLLFISCTFLVFGQTSETDNPKKVTATANFSINSNGIASVPAFTLGDPAFITSVTIAKGRFSYDPVLGYGLDLKPWFLDNWFHYKFIARPIFEMRAGFNYSTFFSEYKLPDETILQGNRYFTYALEAFYTFRPKYNLQFAYWHDHGMDPGTMIGHFISVNCDRTEIELTKRLQLTAGLQVFYINYTGLNDGIFAATKISASVKRIPLIIYFQGIQAISSNIEPFPGFNWNIGLGYVL